MSNNFYLFLQHSDAMVKDIFDFFFIPQCLRFSKLNDNLLSNSATPLPYHYVPI